MFGGIRMVTKKDRRKSGYVTPNLTISKKELEKYNLVVMPFWDDWCDWRDGFRDWYNDFKLIKKLHWKTRGYYHNEMWEKRMQMNKKQKRLIKRRTRRKEARLVSSFISNQS